MIEQFKREVEEGLNSSPKTLPSKYFYDKKGDQLFIEIMNMPEYYLTRAEMDIFKNQTDEIIDALEVRPDQYFEFIELGAGDGTKTRELLKALNSKGYQFDYFPVDISQNALDGLEEMLSDYLPEVNVKKLQGDYFKMLSSLKDSKQPKVVLFLGSNIGNMPDDVAHNFIYSLGSNLHPGDRLLLGVDLIKAREIVLPAYNDKAGITRAFNLNLLSRINKELGGDFSIDHFEHAPEYTEEDGIARSFLKSKRAQTVYIRSIDRSFHFEAGEKIHTEISRKYNDKVLTQIIEDTDFSIAHQLTDKQGLFADYVLLRN